LGTLMSASGLGALGVALALFSLSQKFWLSVAPLVPVGASIMIQMASSNTLIQAMVPDPLRGRVMSVYSMMFLGMSPFGGLLAGYHAERLGAPTTVALGGGICLTAAIVFRVKLPALRGEARRLIAAQGLAGGGEPPQSSGSAL